MARSYFSRSRVASILNDTGLTDGQLQKITGIPVPTLRKFRTGEYIPRERSLKRFKSSYRQITYQHMRSCYVPKNYARRFRDRAWKDVEELSDRYRYAGLVILDHWDKTESELLEAFDEFEYTPERWINYVSEVKAG